MVHMINTLVADGGGTPDTSEETTETSNELVLADENLELDLPFNLNEVLNDISDCYSAGLQDLVDGFIQIKTVNTDVRDNDCWTKSIVKEAVYDLGESDFSKYLDYYKKADSDSLLQFTEDNVSILYDNYLQFANYSLNVEYMVALINKELASCLTAEEYAEFIAAVKDNSDINSFEDFMDNVTVKKCMGYAMQRVGVNFGLTMKDTGIMVWQTFLAKGLSGVIELEHGKLLAEGIKKFAAGAYVGGATGATEAAASNSVAVFGSKIISSVGLAAVFFAAGLVSDKIHGELTWENTAIRAAKAGVSVAAGYAGAAVTEAIIAGSTAGSWAGVIGSAVGAAIAVIGNLAVDKIVHQIKYTRNGMPRNYTDVSTDDIREMLKESGYLATSAKLSENATESAYDEYAMLLSKGADPTLVKFFEQKSFGYSTKIMEPDDYQHYLDIHERFLAYMDHGFFEVGTPGAIDDFLNMYKYQFNKDYRETDDEYIINLFNFFGQDDPEVKNFLDRMLNGEILGNYYEFDNKYVPEY